MSELCFLGLSITSAWGNGHAITYRALIRELAAAGHRVIFLERDVPWYAAHRDLPAPPYCETRLYSTLEELEGRFAETIARADLVVVGSYVPDGIAVGRLAQRLARGVTAFYDIDTPVTLQALKTGACEYLSRELVPGYDLYLSFTGGPTLRHIERALGSPMARPLYCSGDPDLHHPAPSAPRWDLGYLGTYSADRQPGLARLLLEPARLLPEGRFVVAGPLYPAAIEWPARVSRIEHLAPPDHAAFYGAQRFTLNLTRADMTRAGHSPSVRLFEAALCGVPVITDVWSGLDTFFKPGLEILPVRSPEEVVAHLTRLPDAERRAVGERARARVLAEHTAAHRAAALMGYLDEAREARTRPRSARA